MKESENERVRESDMNSACRKTIRNNFSLFSPFRLARAGEAADERMKKRRLKADLPSPES